MISLARFVLKGPGQAALVAAALAILGLVFMPASWFSAAAIALVVLVKGPREGLRLVAFATIGAAALLLLVTGRPEMALFFVLMVWLPVWIPAVVLKQTVSLALSLLLISAISMLACVMFYAVLPGFEQGYVELITEVIRQLVEQYQLQLEPAQLEEVTALIARLLPGMVISSLMLGAILSLLLARWWQAVLYNPGGFADEFQSLRLGRSSALVASAVLLAALLLRNDLTIALAMVVFTLYLLQGTSLLHAMVRGLKLNGVWLFVVYALLFFVPHIIVLMVLAGIADAYVDFRRRLPAG